MADGDYRRRVAISSTRLTWRHLRLAQEAVASVASARAPRVVSPPAPVLALADLCLGLYDRGEPAVDYPEGSLKARISGVLHAAAGATQRCSPSRTDFAQAVLHFVERLIGFAPSASRVRAWARRELTMDYRDFSVERRRGRHCGTYGTPDFIVHAMVADLLKATRQTPGPLRVLDLSIEGGQFPLTILARRSAGRPIRYFGMDRDAVALALAAQLVGFVAGTQRTDGFSMRTVCQDSLLDPLPGGWPSSFGAIIGNPPWHGTEWSRSEGIRARFGPKLAGRFDVYLAFILRAHELLAPGGFLSFVVPNAFLFNVSAAPVRRLLLEHYDVLTLRLYPQRSFVELPCVIPISFLARKRTRPPDRGHGTVVAYESPGFGGHDRPTGRRCVHVAAIWKRLEGCGFNPVADPAVAFLLNMRADQTLADFGTLWSGGRLARATAVEASLAFAGIHARDIRPFHVCPRGLRTYRPGQRVFDRVPRQEFIKSRKVVFQDLRYTTHPERLVAALGDQGTYPVSTASMFVPHEDDAAEYFEALLNSAFANAWYKVRDVSRSIKLLYLQDLPVVYDGQVWRQIAGLARRCHRIRSFYHRCLPTCTLWREEAILPTRFPALHAEFADSQQRIDRAIFALYGISGARRRAATALSAARVF